ncbi:MAG: voltage-gated sodium channel [Chlorobiaceae bacterium]|nr:voltage-gated sodium channel [Chlorobiaceae bacterium]MBA4310584.1 voltage-gated sodium channel [Chlorobiaceae bacterium]
MKSELRKKIGEFIESQKIQRIIITLIIINSITIGMETFDSVMEKYGTILLTIDRAILFIFVIEIILKLFAFRLSFFKNAWNVFDFVIVAIALFPASGIFAVLRSLRILRTLRLLKTVPRLRFIIEALLRTLPSLGWIFVLLMLVIYVFAVIGTKLFGNTFPEWFGTLWLTMFTLFQIMTLEGWAEIARALMTHYPISVFYFLLFILIASYTALNIFIAVVVNTMNEIEKKNEELEMKNLEKIIKSEKSELREEIFSLKNEIQNLREDLKKIK